MDPTTRVREIFREHVATVDAAAESLSTEVAAAARAVAQTLRAGNKILACGNGGSAADAQHFSSEMLNRFERERGGLPAIALTCDSSTLTSIANDYDYAEVFARQIQALGQPGDALLAITTSGQSPSIVNAIDAARQRGMHCVLLTGRDGGRALQHLAGSDVGICVEGGSTARIQELHILIIHCLCDLVDTQLLQQD